MMCLSEECDYDRDGTSLVSVAFERKDMGLLDAFQEGTFGITFFSRGRGRGHAVPDMAIVEEVKVLVPELDVRFVSYSSGAEAFRSRGYDVIDIGVESDPQLLDMIVHEARTIGSLAPQLVIAHEEFAALPTAEIFRIPCVFITDFFLDPTSLPMNAQRYAAEVIFTAERGVFTEPPYLRGKVQYVGPAVRSFKYRPDDPGYAQERVPTLTATDPPGGHEASCEDQIITKPWYLTSRTSRTTIGPDHKLGVNQMQYTLESEWLYDICVYYRSHGRAQRDLCASLRDIQRHTGKRCTRHEGSRDDTFGEPVHHKRYNYKFVYLARFRGYTQHSGNTCHNGCDRPATALFGAHQE
jgi:hypothetical protein